MRDFILIKKTKLYHHWLKQMANSYDVYKIICCCHSAYVGYCADYGNSSYGLLIF